MNHEIVSRTQNSQWEESMSMESNKQNEFLGPNQQITPERFLNAINAYQLTEAVKSAIELEIFTAISEGNTTSAAVAKRCDATERGIRILCDFLTIHNFLTKQGTTYSLTADSALFLDRRSHAYIGSAIEFLLTPRLRDCEAHKVLDLAASHGMYGIDVAKQNPSAHIYASDWNNVLEVAQKNADAMGVGDRYHLIPGSAFEADFGSGYDLALITNLLHGFDMPTCTELMRKVHVGLNPEGRAAIAEYIPNPDRVSPPTAAAFSLTMLAATPSGDAYTFTELEAMSKAAGFTRVELSPAELGRNRLVIAHR